MKCKTHPRYLARREPKADCYPCRLLWELTVAIHHGAIIEEEC